jgi:EAL and modified HD-GYP domain-containing signal transduction protein
MFSLLDAVLGRPLAELVGELPLSPEARSALLEGTGPLAPLLACTIAYERADWTQVAELARQFRLDAGEVSAGYFEALARAQEVFGDVAAGRLPARAAPRDLSREG